MKIYIRKNFYDWDEGKMFHKNYYTFRPNAVTYLVGPNGAGKSTLMLNTQQKLKHSKTLCVSVKDVDLNLFGGLGGDMVNQFISSEGQARQSRILSQLGDAIRKMSVKLNKSNKYDSVMILLDNLDSGMSVDVCIEFNRVLKEVIIPDLIKLGKPWYLIIAINQYEMIKDAKHCLAIPTLKYIHLNSYKEYIDTIIALKIFYT